MHRTTLHLPLILTLALGALGACAGATPGATAPELQAAEKIAPAGARVYAAECASCHGDRGQGEGAAPPVMGAGALPRQGGHRPEFQSAADLFGYVKSAMPLPKKRAGSLSEEQYWAVTTYMAAASGKKVPEGGLSAENAASVSINP